MIMLAIDQKQAAPMISNSGPIAGLLRGAPATSATPAKAKAMPSSRRQPSRSR